MNLLTSLKSAGIAAGLALAIGVAPAMAAPSVTFSFGGPGPGPYFGGGPGIHLHFGDPKYFKYCLDDDGIEWGLEHKGWDHVHVIRHNHNDDWDNKVWVVAQDYKGDWYQMRVDRCTHKVDKVHLVHLHNKGPFNFNNFHFTFSF